MVNKPRVRVVKVTLSGPDAEAFDAALAAQAVQPSDAELARVATRIGLRQILGRTPTAGGVVATTRAA